MGRPLQTDQGGDLLGGGGLFAEIVACQISKPEFLIGREFVGKLQFHGLGQCSGRWHELSGRWFFKAQEGIGGFYFHPFARIQLHLK